MSTGNPRLTLLAGKERFLKNEFLEFTRKRLFVEGPAGLNSQEFYAEKNAPSEIFDFVNTAPFGAAFRLAVVWGVENFDKDEKETFLTAARKISSTAVLVLESEESPKKDPFLKNLSKIGRLESCHAPFERDLPGWVMARAKKSGVTLDREATAHLLRSSGGELSALVSTIEQLTLLVHPRTQITRADAESLIKEKTDSDVFGLADLLLDRKQSEALKVMRGLFEEGARAPEIIASLAGQIERLRKASERLAQGARAEEIGFELRIPPFFQGAFFARLRQLPSGRLADLGKNLLACDESFKSGQATERLALEKFILQS